MPKNPPHLIRVEFTIWWHLYTEKERNQAQLIQGDLFSKIKSEYPKRSVTSQDLFLFKKDEESLYEIELTKESLTFSSRDNKYVWSEFESKLKYLINQLFPILLNYLDLDHIHLELMYVDFFEENFKNISLEKYYKDKLNLGIETKFIDREPSDLNFKFAYKVDEGDLEVQVGKGKHMSNNGIVLISKIISNKEEFEIKHTLEWIKNSHEITSELYQNVINKEAKA